LPETYFFILLISENIKTKKKKDRERFLTVVLITLVCNLALIF